MGRIEGIVCLDGHSMCFSPASQETYVRTFPALSLGYVSINMLVYVTCLRLTEAYWSTQDRVSHTHRSDAR